MPSNTPVVNSNPKGLQVLQLPFLTGELSNLVKAAAKISAGVCVEESLTKNTQFTSFVTNHSTVEPHRSDNQINRDYWPKITGQIHNSARRKGVITICLQLHT